MAAGGDRLHEALAVQPVAALAVGPAGREHLVLPLLQDRGRAVPVHRVLEHEHLVRGDERLLAARVDEEIRIGLVQVVQRDAGEVLDRRAQRAAGARAVVGRVGIEHEDAAGHANRRDGGQSSTRG